MTTTPAKDLTDANLAKYDVLLLNYKDTAKGAPETQMVRRQQGGLPRRRSRTARGWSSFTTPRAPSQTRTGTSSRRPSPAAGGSQGFHGPKHVYTVKKTQVKHPISEGLPAQFEHTIDELYQNSVMVPGNEVLATAYSDPGKKPRAPARTSRSSGSTRTARGASTTTPWATMSSPCPTPISTSWIRRGVIWAARGHVDPQASLETRPFRRLPVKEYRDKMKAGWIGQMAGVGWGGPTEFKFQGEIMPGRQDARPGSPTMINQFGQDDLYVEMTFLRTLEQYGLDVSIRQAGIDFANSGYPLWHANQAGPRPTSATASPRPTPATRKFNTHADDIDYQIEADFSGLIAPGMPNVAIALGEKFGRLMNYGDGLYAGQFIGGMYAEAFFENDPVKIVEAGLRCIPAESQYAECVRDVLAWHKRESQRLGEDLGTDRREVPEEPGLPPVLVQQEREGPTSSTSTPRSTGPTSSWACSTARAISTRRSSSPAAAARTPTATRRAPPACCSRPSASRSCTSDSFPVSISPRSSIRPPTPSPG